MEQALVKNAPTSLFPPPSEVVRMASPAGVAEAGYYGLPALKRPLWGWEIALYFFGEGISSGCYVLATAADFFGDGHHRQLIRAARYISWLTMVPCPPLLIADLGRPERFHHMLRIFKPLSPMNLGAWALLGFGQPVTYLALQEAAGHLPAVLRPFVRWAPRRVVALLGLPFALTMLAYPGVLLSMTSTPVWTRSRLTGPLLGASSMAMSASALALVCDLDRRMGRRSRGAIGRIETFSHICEAALLWAYIKSLRENAGPLMQGSQSRLFRWGGIGIGLVAPAVLRALAGKRNSRRSGIWSAVLSLAGGLALKWALVHAGRESAYDPAANRRATQPTRDNPGWTGVSSPQIGSRKPALQTPGSERALSPRNR
jgi:formate-dependent nitrite reductase membrane component NrfD